jgi:enterochelin esterase-like enzyme
LGERPYRGLVVVCPYTPDILAGDRPFRAAAPLAKFLVDELLPRVKRETPAVGSAETTAIDGVSLGGRAALLVGLERPTAFRVVAGLQAAFDSADAPELARRARDARQANPSLVFRLLTSEGDYFLNANRAISRAFAAAGVPHALTVIPGPHDYEFNRGPGAYEMLFFHDRALRGEVGLDPVR